MRILLENITENEQTTRYVRFKGDTVATIGCLDQDQDDNDRYQAGPHNFP